MRHAALTIALLASTNGCARLLGIEGDYELASQPSDAGSDATREVESDGASDAASVDASTAMQLPKGKLVYHRFTNYGAGDAEMFIIDLPSGKVSPEIGVTYGLCHPLNGIFHPDGKRMLVSASIRTDAGCGPTNRDILEVFELDLTRPGEMRQLTVNDLPDEDPQYSFDGSFLVFKHNGHVAERPVEGEPFVSCDQPIAGAFCFGTGEGEQSKPVLTPDSQVICYYEGHLADADIYCFSRADGLTGRPLSEIRFPAVVHGGVTDQRPTIDERHLYYVRARSVTNPVTYIARNPLSDLSGLGEDARFCVDEASNYRDPCTLAGDLMIFSSDQAGKGGFDLFVAEFASTKSASLDAFVPGINSPKEDLGAAFWRDPEP